MKLEYWANIKHKGADEESIIFADRVEYIANKQGDFFDHHLMFYLGKKLVFKVYLKNGLEDWPYETIKEACEAVDIRLT